ncbi:MAG: protein kinase [Marinicella sp.]|nr:protein kinase [Xanthomonadales bacterium]
MTDSSFAQIQLLFSALNDLEETVQNNRIEQLLTSGELNEQQADLLKSMLAADKQPDIPTQIQSASVDLLDQLNELMCYEPDNQLGPYSLIKKIGSGGMGQVFLAERNDGQFEQQVAIKVSHAHLNEELLKRFETERQILSDLNHPHIARLLDGGTGSQGQPYLVMEYIDGHSIDQYCVNHKPNLNGRIELILQACDAISLAHQNLILHRDLKPDNIMVSRDGQIKVVDFGIAKLLEPTESAKALTATQIMTRYYASPEQIKGQHVSTQSDLFSLGIIAYELITGCHPFIKNDTDINQHQRESNVLSGEIMHIAHRHQIEKPLFPELSQIPDAKIQGDLENILRKAMFNDLSQRYQSVDAFAADLRNFLANKPVTARKPSLFYTAKKLIQRQKIAATAILLTVVALITSTGFSMWKAEEALQQKKLAEQQRQLAEIESEKATQIADFVKTMFEKAKPESSDKQLTAQDLLFQGFKDADEADFIHQETKYDLLALIHLGLKSLGKYEESLVRLDQHYTACVEQVSQTNQSCQSLLDVKAKIQTTLRQDQAALETLAIAEQVALSRVPVNRHELFDFYAIKNTALLHLDRIEESRQLQQHMFNIETAASDPDQQRLVQILHNLSLSYILHDEYEQARIYMDQIPGYLEKFDPEILPLWLGAHYGLEAYYHSSLNEALKAYEFRKKRVDLMDQSFAVKPENYGSYLKSAGDMAFRSGLIEISLKHFENAFQFYHANISHSESYQYQLLLKITLHYFMINQPENAKQWYAKTAAYDQTIKSASSTSRKLALIVELFNGVIEQSISEDKLTKKCSLDGEKNKLIHFYCKIITTKNAINNRNWTLANSTLESLLSLSAQTPHDYLVFKEKTLELMEILKQESIQ